MPVIDGVSFTDDEARELREAQHSGGSITENEASALRAADGWKYQTPDEAKERGQQWVAREGEPQDLSDTFHYQTPDQARASGIDWATQPAFLAGRGPGEHAGAQALAMGGRTSAVPGVAGMASYGAQAGAGGAGGGSGGGGGMMGFGGAPAAFGETYTPLARPSHLQGEYVPGQWGEQFTAPQKSATLQQEYALPTQAELEASPGYLAGQDAMQRGMERSAAAKGTVLSGGFVGRALPRAMGEYAGGAYNNLVGQTMGARQQQYGEYSTDANRAFGEYQQRYGQFTDAEGLKLGARNVNETAFQGDQGSHLAGYNTRYGQYLDTNAAKRQSETDLWGRELDLADVSLRAAALARPY